MEENLQQLKTGISHTEDPQSAKQGEKRLILVYIQNFRDKGKISIVA